MRMPLSRTRAKLVHALKGTIFDAADFQSMVDLRDKHLLEDSMGFRGQFDEHRRFQIDLLKAQGLEPHHNVLELGCGPLTAGIPLIGYLEPGRYVGVDIRNSVLDLAWREIGKAKLSSKNPRLICSPSFALAEFEEKTFDYVYSFSVLYHLSDDILDSYFRAVSKHLKPSGVCIANVNTQTSSDRWLEFPFLRRTVETYKAMAASHGLETMSLGTLQENGFRNLSAENLNPILRFSLTSR
jgi:cyclopropane fatty-acyl-phospholipid synthase-like methyltransferase